MKNTPIIVILVLLLVLIGMLFYRLHSLESRLNHEHHKTEHEHHGHDDDDGAEDEGEDDDEYPLGEKMSKIFYFKNKLGSALNHDNSELSLFYLEEIEEIAEEIVGDDVYHEGVHISVLMQDKLFPAIEHLEAQLENSDAKKAERTDAFENLISSCNSCHKLAEHPFIQVEAPSKDVDGQNFKVAKD